MAAILTGGDALVLADRVHARVDERQVREDLEGSSHGAGLLAGAAENGWPQPVRVS
jgi:hypothetical protein